MRTIFDAMTDRSTGNMEEMARQFGIAQEQAQAGMAALMPAFAEGMRRVMTNPADFARLMQAYATMAQAGAEGAAAQAKLQHGNEILAQLFGSKELSRAVAAQAAQATGLSTEILKHMLPAMAPKILEILFGQMMGGAGRRDNPFGKMFEEMMRGTGGQNPWGRMLEQMAGSGSAGDNPLGRMFEEMLGGGRPRPGERPRRDDGAEREKPRRGPLEEMIGDMFDTGRAMQREYQTGIETIFDEFLAGKKKR